MGSTDDSRQQHRQAGRQAGEHAVDSSSIIGGVAAAADVH